MRQLDPSDGSVGTEEALSSVLTHHPSSNGSLHSIKAQPGEDLHEGYFRSYAGFLLRETNRVVQVDQAVVKQEIDFLSNFVAIAYFVGET